MMILRRAENRRYVLHRKQEIWLTFYPGDATDNLSDGFGFLRFLNDKHLPPGAGMQSYPLLNAEVVTFVMTGALSQMDSTGKSGVVRALEVQRMRTEDGIRHGDRNRSQLQWSRVIRLAFCPVPPGPDYAIDKKYFSKEQRTNRLRVLVSPDGRDGSLPIRSDVYMYSSILEPGHHVVHPLHIGRMAWIHIVNGEGTSGAMPMSQGDGMGIRRELSVSFAASSASEILIVDMPEDQSRFPDHPSAQIEGEVHALV